MPITKLRPAGLIDAATSQIQFAVGDATTMRHRDRLSNRHEHRDNTAGLEFNAVCHIFGEASEIVQRIDRDAPMFGRRHFFSPWHEVGLESTPNRALGQEPGRISLRHHHRAPLQITNSRRIYSRETTPVRAGHGSSVAALPHNRKLRPPGRIVSKTAHQPPARNDLAQLWRIPVPGSCNARHGSQVSPIPPQ